MTKYSIYSRCHTRCSNNLPRRFELRRDNKPLYELSSDNGEHVSKIDFTHRVAVVTGAGGGLGRDYALQLAARGAAVVVNDLGATTTGSGQDKAPAEAVVRSIVDSGGWATASYDSVATRAGAEAIVAAAMDHFGRIDVVVNNAGNQRNGRIEQLSDEDFDEVLAVHLNGAFYVSQAAYKQMIKQRYGRLIFTSSASGVFGNYIRANYAAAKAGLIGLMHSFALEGAYAGVLANALLPTAASRLGQAPAHAILPEWEAFQPEKVPGIERIGAKIRAEYVTPLVLYLASERCTSSHGMWSATGGRYARAFVGVTRGWLGPSGRPPTPEEIAANLAQIEDRGGFTEPHTVAAELADVARISIERGA